MPDSVPVEITQNGGRRRSPIAARLGSLGDVGGRNSFNNFAQSWHRASGFLAERETNSEEELDEEEAVEVSDEVHYRPSRLVPDVTNLGSIQTPAQSTSNPETQRDGVDARLQRRATLHQRHSSRTASAHVANTFDTTRHNSATQSETLLSQQNTTIPISSPPVDEETPLITKHTESGIDQPVNPGESTFYQTSFNLINALIGMSMLAVPYGIRLSGWIVGLSSFAFAAVVTAYTGTLLARAMEKDPSGALSTYDDLAYVAYGRKMRAVVRALFNLELVAVCVALIILAADCFHSLVPEVDVRYWKLICGAIVTPLCVVPMRILSITSVLGIISSVAIVMIVFIAGFTKPQAPGSLRSPAPTDAWSDDWSQFPKAFGILMACYGAHSIFPNFYRDMRKPQKFDRAIFLGYGSAWFVQLILGITGYLMFGSLVRDEVTINVFETQGYARWISTGIIVAMAVLPLTKIPLNIRPIIATLNTLLNVSPTPTSPDLQVSSRTRILRTLTTLLTPLLLVTIAILIPSFDRVVSILGNLLCCLISVIFPCLFHLRLYDKELPRWRRWLEWGLVGVFMVPAVGGTVWVMIPR